MCFCTPLNSLIITILANLHYYKWAMYKPHTFIYKKDILINHMIHTHTHTHTHTHKIDDTIFLQALGGIKENSLKDKIETTNSENVENGLPKYNKTFITYYDADKFKTM